ncbi:hypothetical protein CR513_05271, partial [Mucuna pruriens]
MVMRFMNNMNGKEAKSQRENIFHSRFLMLGKLCSIIVDGGGKLGIPTLPHRKPYNRQVSLNFTLGKYVDEVMCDVVSMEAAHILLGRSLQFDRKVTHDEVSNRFSLVYLGEKVVLKPLSLGEVCEDQIKMRIKRKKEIKEKKKVKKTKEKKEGKRKGKATMTDKNKEVKGKRKDGEKRKRDIKKERKR